MGKFWTCFYIELQNKRILGDDKLPDQILHEPTQSDLDFYNALVSEDPLAVVVKSVIHIEQELNEIFTLLVSNAKAFNKLDLTYHQKVGLAVSLGLDESFQSPLNTIGTIRNKFAHQLIYQLSPNDVGNFYKSFRAEHKTVIQLSYSKIREKRLREGGSFEAFSKIDPIDKFVLCAMILRTAMLATKEHIRRQGSVT